MFDKLDFILEKYEELSMLVADPEVIADQTKWRKLMKDMGDMEPIVLKYKEYKKAKEEIEDTKLLQTIILKQMKLILLLIVVHLNLIVMLLYHVL